MRPEPIRAKASFVFSRLSYRMFRFKQFTICDDRCAMKVGTDGVLLGAWASADDAQHILDVGAGCGLVALMIAQRAPEAHVLAIEIDGSAAAQALENVQQSPFADRVEVLCDDFVAFAANLETSPASTSSQPFNPAQHYDLIVSNPPFFEENLLPPDARRANARHTQGGGLTFENFIASSARLLCDGGHLQVIIPKSAQTRFHAICTSNGLSLMRATDVQTVVRKAPKRVLLDFAKVNLSSPQYDSIVLMEQGVRSEAYTRLCGDFYL